MITKIEIKGFKSLSNVSIDFSKGLNVLIGPNGSGKTNICQAFGLISANVKNHISDYILTLGGANSIFSKKSREKDRKSKSITISCNGELKHQKKCIRYVYSFSLSLNLKKDELKVSKEKIQILIEGKPAIEISKNALNSAIVTVNSKLMGPNQLGRFKKKSKGRIVIRSYGHEKTLFELGSYLFMYCFLVMRDLVASDALDIDPHIAKKSSNILESKTMSSNGKYLANAIKTMHSQSPEKMKRIDELLKLVYQRHKSIMPKTNENDGTNDFVLVDNEGSECLANNLSDGTIKSIGLQVGILTHKHNTLIIEELENYLHPWACQIFIQHLREISEDKVYILTTHSETILNVIRPKEIIVCNNVKGSTRVKRIKDIAQLEKSIELSGFGCGYHYVGGVIGGILDK